MVPLLVKDGWMIYLVSFTFYLCIRLIMNSGGAMQLITLLKDTPSQSPKHKHKQTHKQTHKPKPKPKPKPP